MANKHKCKACNKTFVAEKIVERNGKTFKQHLHMALYCSNECRTSVVRESAKKSWWNGGRNKYLKKKTRGNCVICGYIYYTFKPSHQKTCLSKHCQRENHNRTVRVSNGKTPVAIAKTFNLKCELEKCGKKFTVPYRQGTLPKYCSPRCCKAKYANSDKGKKNVSKYTRRRRRTDIGYHLQGRIKHRVREALRNEVKGRVRKKRGRPVEDIIGCSVKDLKRHIEEKFTKGMSWRVFMSGSGSIHLDHIRPCVSFDLTKESEQRKCFNYKNLQPLWAKDNLSKGAKIAA